VEIYDIIFSASRDIYFFSRTDNNLLLARRKVEVVRRKLRVEEFIAGIVVYERWRCDGERRRVLA
jgi:hypothetical protein